MGLEDAKNLRERETIPLSCRNLNNKKITKRTNKTRGKKAKVRMRNWTRNGMLRSPSFVDFVL